ncbi:uncharacterized protein B0H18DRAFT_935413 [Fomitopsis serialis]|uniref:uncharacterized protein n=1 Tax=Fomitopsis serialis TaxID=139415 RepID=UPI002008BAA4|nr:uncharacterized protein B0H18DRAFT_935413 [Neoantrodia serialis]KAH9922415.1 hypothetical protein B0H18DRAFT_935413 [Neoantrodia serialis]
MLEEHRKVQALPRDPSDPPGTEVAVAPLIVYSDSTRLASFGDASLWPVYLFFGWVSKYIRGKPSSFAAHHLAYLPTEAYLKIYNVAASSDILRFCKQELIHAIWRLILDPEFMHAYEHGCLVKCGDGIWRRLFPRFFIYAADYPEKVLLACIRYLAQCPCPRCLVQKSELANMGSQEDMQHRTELRTDSSFIQRLVARARLGIFKKGWSLGSKKISNILSSVSLTATRSAFSERLSRFGFNHYSMFVPDVMHECELGVWKALLMHLLRILYAEGKERIQTFNQRRFHRNVSALKQLAARDYEDILQTIIPVFEGLLPPPHNEIILDLLFEFALFHGLSKLRLHTEETLKIFSIVTKSLGELMARFKAETCEAYDTYELPREEAARGRRTAAMRQRASGHGKTHADDHATPQSSSAANPGRSKKRANETVAQRKEQLEPVTRQATNRRKRKEFNLQTFKWHSFGDYPRMIPIFGTLDVMNTQTGEQEHRRLKRYYLHTNKKKTRNRQICKRERRVARLREIARRDCERAAVRVAISAQDQPTSGTLADSEAAQGGGNFLSGAAALRFEASESLPSQTPPTAHYHISDDASHSENLRQWLHAHRADPAFNGFEVNLRNHLLGRIRGRSYDGDEDGGFTDEDRDTIRFEHSRVYFHKVLRINYTTYDKRRAQDSVNPRTHADVMLLAHDDDDGDNNHAHTATHPYWYARVVGVLHFDVKVKGVFGTTKYAQRMDVLWVRWFGYDYDEPGGFRTRRLHRVGFVDHTDPSALGFIDPHEVIRACHLMPASAHGRTQDYLPPSAVRQADEHHSDYKYYYVGMFVDRDMLMRYIGGAVGHRGSGSVHLHEDAEAIFTRAADTSDSQGAAAVSRACESTEPEEWDDVPDVDEDEGSEDEDAPSHANDLAEIAVSEKDTVQVDDILEDEEQDYGYCPSDGSDSDSTGEDDVDDGVDGGVAELDSGVQEDLGPEDGEDGDYDDPVDDLGYAPL